MFPKPRQEQAGEPDPHRLSGGVRELLATLDQDF